MIGNQFSIILLPTNKCNVDCEYCFEDKTADFMSLEQLKIITEKLLDHMELNMIHTLMVYWQGGEVMIMKPEWFERAYEIMGAAFARRNARIEHFLQSNMIGYSPKWNTLIREMFGNSIGTSMDYPNLYRKAKRRTPEDYTELWTRNINIARDAGIHIGVISIPNKATLEVGAERFYSYFVDELMIDDFQINTSFSGGEENAAKEESVLNMGELSKFMVELAEVWAEIGIDKGIKLGPIDELLKRFLGEGGCLPCIWQQNCADEFVSIDARGYVAQCDCWVTSYPEYRFGNIFADKSFTELIEKSRARRRFEERPAALMRNESCAECEHLSVCHGGCPVRTYAITGEFFNKDPYCQVYKALFACLDDIAVRVSATKFRRSLPVLPAFATSAPL